MLIKIGNALVDPNEIAVIQPDRNERLSEYDKSTHILIELRNGGSIWIEASMDEAEAALIDAGVVTDLTASEDTGFPSLHLTDEETEKLYELESDGYRFMARDQDGKLYAYRHKPEYGGFYWNDPSPSNATSLQIDDFSFIDQDNPEPTAICCLLNYPNLN